jgi:hemerythrin-like domain-containing protein
MSQPDKKTMEELSDDHGRLRSIANRLIEARNRFGGSSNAGAGEIRSIMHDLVTFYPAHIDKEDKHFFIPCMEYLTVHEQDDMFEAFAEFDRKVIHDKYRAVVERIEGRRKGPSHAGED